MKVEIKKKLIKKMVKDFAKPKTKFKIGILLGERNGKLIKIDDFYFPKQIYDKKGIVSEIPSSEFIDLTRKFEGRIIGLMFYMRNHKACDTVINEKMRERCAMFGMVDLSLAINEKSEYNFFSNRRLEVSAK